MKTTILRAGSPVLVSALVLLCACGGEDKKPAPVDKGSGVQKLQRETPKDEGRLQPNEGTEKVVLSPEAVRLQQQIKLLRERLKEAEADDDFDAIAEQLGRISELGERGKDLWPQVLEAATHEDPFVRGFALQAAAKINPAASREVLEKALGDEEPSVREAVVQAWGTAGIKDLTPLLSRVNDEFDPKVQFAILHTVAEVGDASHMDQVVGVLDSLMPNALKPAVRFLAEKGGSAQAERIAGFIERDDMDLRVAVSRSLEQLGDKSKPVLLALTSTLTDDDLPVRMAGFTALKTLTGQDLGYDPRGPEETRANAAKAFQEWIDRN
jgi:HEAT repeat protein